MPSFLHYGFLSQVEVLLIEPFQTENDALAVLDMQKVKLADGTTAVFPRVDLEKILTVIDEPVVEEPIEEIPVEPVVEEPVVKPQKKQKKVSAETTVADQDAAVSKK